MSAGDLAGLINESGKIYYKERFFPKKSCVVVEPALKVESKDKKLLIALKKKFGGQISEEQKGLLNWNLSDEGLQKLLSLINPFLLISKN